MDNPRLQSIKKSQDADFSPDNDEVELSKSDRFAFLAKVIEPAIATFLNTPENQEYIDTLDDKRTLDTFMMNAVYDVLKDTLNEDAFREIHDRLAAHQHALFEAKRSMRPDYEGMLLAGASTFMNNTSNVFSLLERAYGPDRAAHPNNWRIIDKLARMNIQHQAAYSQIYLSESVNWTHAIDHFTPDPVRGGVKFVTGFPLQALVPTKTLDSGQRMFTRDDLMISKNDDFIDIASIEATGATIGCPVTFQNQSLIRLWSLYASARQRMSPY